MDLTFDSAIRALPDNPALLLKEGEVASILCVSVRTLQALRLKGGGPPFVKIGRLVRYISGQLRAWVEDRIMRSTSDEVEVIADKPADDEDA